MYSAVRSLTRQSAAVVCGIALTVVGAVATSAHAASPINPNNRPTALPGAVNGVVPASRLVNVAPNCAAAG